MCDKGGIEIAVCESVANSRDKVVWNVDSSRGRRGERRRGRRIVVEKGIHRELVQGIPAIEFITKTNRKFIQSETIEKRTETNKDEFRNERVIPVISGQKGELIISDVGSQNDRC